MVVYLLLNPYIVAVDLEGYEGLLLAGVSSGSFATPAQYEYKFVVTHVGI